MVSYAWPASATATPEAAVSVPQRAHFGRLRPVNARVAWRWRKPFCISSGAASVRPEENQEATF
eukprot:9449739-Pyramimonas_sp.AAC.1